MPNLTIGTEALRRGWNELRNSVYQLRYLFIQGNLIVELPLGHYGGRIMQAFHDNPREPQIDITFAEIERGITQGQLAYRGSTFDTTHELICEIALLDGALRIYGDPLPTNHNPAQNAFVSSTGVPHVTIRAYDDSLQDRIRMLQHGILSTAEISSMLNMPAEALDGRTVHINDNGEFQLSTPAARQLIPATPPATPPQPKPLRQHRRAIRPTHHDD